MSATVECGCRTPRGSGRVYLGRETCVYCGRLLPAQRRRPSPVEPEMVGKSEGIDVAADLWREYPGLTNAEMYERMAAELKKRGQKMPAFATWMGDWAPSARRRSGTRSVVGRQT